MKASGRLTHPIVLSMILGVIVGYLCHVLATDAEGARAIAGYFSIVTDIFLRMIKMIIAPLVFATLVSGIASIDDTRSISRIALKALAWFTAASLISLIIGLLFVNVTHPGTGMNLQIPAGGTITNLNPSAPNLKEFATNLVPKSIVDAMAGNEIIQILVFSLFFGIALGKLTGDSGLVVKRAIDGLLDVMLRVTTAVMLVAPLGIFAALAAAITVQGLSILITYGRFIGSFYLALIGFWAVLCIAGYIVLGQRMWGLAKLIREPMMIAFSTASSEAAYPKMFDCLQRFGINKRLVGLVLPLGYSFNLDGSMVYQAFATVFIAQAFHIQMSLGRQITMLLVLMISSKGMAAVPRGSLVVVAATLPRFGLPEAGLLLVLGIDQFLDMGRTATNVLGNSVATAVVAQWERELGSVVSVPDENSNVDTNQSALKAHPTSIAG